MWSPVDETADPLHRCISAYDHSCAHVLQDIVPKYPTSCDVEWVDAEDPLFLLYTSGSTGKPKVLMFWNCEMLLTLSVDDLAEESYIGLFGREFCIQLEGIWYIQLQHLSMHLIINPQTYTGTLNLNSFFSFSPYDLCINYLNLSSLVCLTCILIVQVYSWLWLDYWA